MTPQPKLHLVDAATGEIVHQDEKDILIEQQQSVIKGKDLQIGKLKRELRELRAVEPEMEVIRDILQFCRDIWRKRFVISPGQGEGWEKVRARLKDKLDDRPPWTPDELKLAAQGALLDPWMSGQDKRSRGYLQAKTVFKSPDKVQELLDLALGFKAKAGVDVGLVVELADEFGQANLKDLLKVCMCSHRRLEHSRPDPNFFGREGCLIAGCGCGDFDLDWYDPFNMKVEPWLRGAA